MVEDPAKPAAEMLSRTVLPAGSAWPFPTGPVKPPRPKRGPDPEIEEALL